MASGGHGRSVESAHHFVEQLVYKTDVLVSPLQRDASSPPMIGQIEFYSGSPMEPDLFDRIDAIVSQSGGNDA